MQLQLQGVKATKKLRNIQLSEVSLVDVPANPGARIMLLKSDTKKGEHTMQDTTVVIEKLRRGDLDTQGQILDAVQAALGRPPDAEFWKSAEGAEIYSAYYRLPSGLTSKRAVSQPADGESVFTKLLTQKAEEKLAKGEARDLADAYAQADREDPKLYAAACHLVKHPA